MPRPKRDPRILFGYVTAVTYMLIMGGKAAVWGIQDKTHIPLLLAPLLLIGCGIVFVRWWNKTRHEEWVKTGGRKTKVAAAVRTCRKCGSSLEAVEPRPVSIDGLNVVRVVCPRCGTVRE